jgi:hypothetical protein
MYHYSTLSVDYQLQKTIPFKKNKSGFKPLLPFIGVLAFMLSFANASFAQTTTWQGDISSDWYTAGNWSDGVPDQDDYVRIPALTPPNVNPVITSGAVVTMIWLDSDASLTIAVGGTLVISGSATRGMDNSGSIENNGTLRINKVAYDGILVNAGGVFTNKGTINIGNSGSIGYNGIFNNGTFINESGTININRTGSYTNQGGLANKGSFINKASITIGKLTAGLNDGMGLRNTGALAVFLNEAGAEIAIDRTPYKGLLNDAGGAFTNKGSILIGAEGNIGGEGLENAVNSTFNNSTCTAFIKIASNDIIRNAGTFGNAGIIIENATGNSSISSNTGVVQNLNGGTFTVTAGPAAITSTGPIWTGCTSAKWTTVSNWHTKIVPAASDDIAIADVTTNPLIDITDAVAKSVTVESGGALTISAAGILTIDGSTTQGVLNKGTVTNTGLLKIGLTTGTGDYGIRNEGTFNNSSGGTLSIDKATQAALYNFSGTFSNNASLSLKTAVAAPFLVNSNGGAIGNGAAGTLSGTGVINSTHFSNNGGRLSPGYSPGVLTFSANESFSNSTMAIEVNGTGVAGTAYDQVVVNGTATLGGTLAVTFNFPSPVTGDVVKILDATALTGTFRTVTGLPDGWIVNYNKVNQGEITLSYLVSLPVNLINFSAKKQEKFVKLDWQTSEESNNQGFEIERRLDSGMWEKVGFVDGNGTTKENNTYAFLDLNPLPGMNYYRLRQLDFDGKVELSRIVGVKMDSEKLLKIYPNPTTGIINIEGAGSKVRILDILGRLVIDGMIINQKLDVSHLPGGFYILSVSSENKEKSIPIVKQ